MNREYKVVPKLNHRIWIDPVISSDHDYVGFYNYKQDNSVYVKLPSWMKKAISRIKEDAFKEGYTRAKNEVKAVLGIRQ